MPTDSQSEGWKEVEKLLTKGKTQGALELLREIDSKGENATTLRLAGQAIQMEASKSGSKSDYRKAASLFRDAVQINPRDKQANAMYNQIRNEMQDKRISETVIPRMMNDGTPTPAGIFAVVAAGLLIIAAVQLGTTETEYGDAEAIINLTWTDKNGVFHDENVTIKLYRNEAPIHVENFISLAEGGFYQDVPFHRVIEGFMNQGGDFQNEDGTGGHALNWYGYCNGQDSVSEEDCELTSYTIPDEVENGLLHLPGTISMAKTSAPHTGGSQFFMIPSTSTPDWLDGAHTVFGVVTDGIEHVDSMNQIDVECPPNKPNFQPQEKSTPAQPATMVSVTITDDGIIEHSPWYEF